MFKFTKLEYLHQNMQKDNKTRTIFPFEYNGKSFNCIFLTDTLYYQLFLTPTEPNSMVIEFEVGSSYSVPNFLHPYDYKALTDYLDLKIKPRHFFWYLNCKIPTKFTKKPNYRDVLTVVITAKTNRTKKQDMEEQYMEEQYMEEQYMEEKYMEEQYMEEQYIKELCIKEEYTEGEYIKEENTRKEEIEEENKLYFCGWYKNHAGEGVQNANLEKTMYAFGNEICNLCIANNISSCWTNDESDEDIQQLDSIYNMID